ncbi:superoxide dismutase family protein [Terriglobus tenax]|uniref:superoxide dismutase family protein n=1 Tax=Terriglobus tenax TaxID=1111115 RepID=UPI0021DFB3C5|nr:superoxide dismutase family protein [Terriglobus tenax]
MRFAAIASAALLVAVPVFAAAPKPVKVELKDASGKDAGYVTFSPDKKGVKVMVMLANLPAGEHAVHVHAGSECVAPFTSAGGHFNPENKHHGFKNPEGHHDGDFPESVAMTGDMGHKVFVADYLSLDPAAPNSIYGHTVVVHEKADDQTSDPAGNAGSRIACGVIEKPAM